MKIDRTSLNCSMYWGAIAHLWSAARALTAAPQIMEARRLFVAVPMYATKTRASIYRAVRVSWSLEQTGYSAMLHFIRSSSGVNKTSQVTKKELRHSRTQKVKKQLLVPCPRHT